MAKKQMKENTPSKKGASKKGKKVEVAFKPVVVARNKKATYDYMVLDQFECGIILFGSEVKSIRNGKIQITEAFASIKNGEVWLHGANISEYPQASIMNHLPVRERKLLLQKRQLVKLISKLKDKGTTLVPLDVHFSERGYVKVQLALVKGQKEHDKRQRLKKESADRDMRQAMLRRR